MDDSSVGRPAFPAGLKFDPSQFNKFMLEHGHTGFIGMQYRNHGDNWVELGMPWREDLVGDPETGVLASGPIISLLDNATSMAVWALRGAFRPQVTLDLRIDYVRAAAPGKTVIAWAECYQLKRSMAFVRGIAHDGDIADPVAHAAGIFIQVEPEGWARASEAAA
ncbi:MAG: phenylacetic acid degradation protein [Novosphingobium sp. 16-62-11]|nr:MAG: phenylacetic acid degradation protein [Novosphingobium sp. 35-62-5]OYZ46681.1 MAG: phenylacetic acid degradation protein [Novosphingobium sp. 16-62-11]OZA18126.1 MAG: phenylacetic acid degradation protein [Novosphingobium sp. 17-62-19]